MHYGTIREQSVQCVELVFGQGHEVVDCKVVQPLAVVNDRVALPAAARRVLDVERRVGVGGLEVARPNGSFVRQPHQVASDCVHAQADALPDGPGIHTAGCLYELIGH